MKKLNDYIDNETKKSADAEAERKRQNITASIEKENYKENFQNVVFENIYYQILKLKSSDFSVKELERSEIEPLKLRLELEISIRHQIAQYYISFEGDVLTHKNSFQIQFYGTGGKKVLNKKITFEEGEKINFEDYLVTLLEEYSKT